MIKNIYFSVISCIFLLFSCGGDSIENPDEISENEDVIPIGGVFTMPIGSYNKEVQVNEIQKLEESQIYWQIFEGLVKYNAKTLEIEPAIAKEWSISPDGLIYTFEIREDVYFHDNSCFEGGKGRKVTAEDVVYSFEQIYDDKVSNSGYSIFKNTVVGGDAFHDGTTETIEGITTDGNKVMLQLDFPSLAFIKKLASIFGSVIAKEASEAEVFVPVGTGPFVYDKGSSSSELVKLAKNTNYYGVDEKGNKLPYLDSVVFAYYDDNDEQMELFWNGKLSFMGRVPITKISEVLEERIGDFESKPPKFMLKSEPELATTYLELNMTTPVLKNSKVRQALNFAINRKKIVEKLLKNQAYEIGKFGIVPPLPKVLNDYDFEGVEDVSYIYNPQRAKELLAEAGYPEGENFPSLQMQFKAGSIDYLVASEIQSQLRSVLNINLDIEAVEFNQMLENKANGSADIFRTNWVGDYASPEAFLTNAYGKAVPKKRSEPSYLNSSRYQNAEFDALFEQGSQATDPVKANEFFSAAEKVLMEDAVFIILWYGEDLTLEQAFVRDFETNGIGYIDLKKVYFKIPTAAEYANN
jgi:oligopeptide transport system substrate-binding protein